ncbi:MAG: adenylosuccinate synthase [Thermoplasmatota archaeon]
MSLRVVVGTQWGDEGKGKIVDYFAKDADYVVRFQGGNNAGHTIKNKDEVYKLHIIPSGVIQGKTGVIGNGCVVDPIVLINEIDELTSRGIQPDLLISDRVHLIMPYHRVLDGASERLLKDEKIGTTKRGIGPCYSDKIARQGIRAIDLLDRKRLEKRLDKILPIKQKLFDAYGIKEGLDKKKLLQQYLELGNRLKPFISDTAVLLNKAISDDKRILFEGAQGAMLDVDFGTYPFTTSSHVIVGGSTIGTGVPPKHIHDVIGIVKAYTTRVGEGPLPTELFDDIGKHIQKKGHEFGTTTSRPRRCGWLDLVVVKHACMLSGVSEIALTKLDVLDELEAIKICTGYSLHDRTIDTFPASIDQLKDCRPIYERFDGWNTSLDQSKHIDDLPVNAQKYIQFIEEYLQVPISIVSVGPDRKETFEVSH